MAGKPSGTLQERFDARYIPEPNTGCWFWVGSSSPTIWGDYGIIYEAGKQQLAHRISVRLDGREIPEGYHVDHKCRNTLLCEPRPFGTCYASGK